MKKHLTLLAAITVLVIGAVTASLAQAPGGGGPGPGGGAGPGTGVPIDGGASFLLVGGAAYAVRKLRARRKNA